MLENPSTTDADRADGTRFEFKSSHKGGISVRWWGSRFRAIRQKMSLCAPVVTSRLLQTGQRRDKPQRRSSLPDPGGDYHVGNLFTAEKTAVTGRDPSDAVETQA